MHVVVHVSKHYDWEPLPSDVKPTEDDIKARRVRPRDMAQEPDGSRKVVSWNMRVERERKTHTTLMIPESEIQGAVLRGAIREHQIHNRSEALGHHMARDVMEHHAHPRYFTGFEVHDDGPSEGDIAAFDKVLDVHVAAGNLTADDKAAILDAYKKPLGAEEHIQHLHTRFNVPRAAAPKTEAST